jgi:hypothetical protein
LISSKTASSQVLLEKDDSAPYKGILFPMDKAQDVRIQLLERDKYKEMTESLERSKTLLNENVALLEGANRMLFEQNDKLAKELYQVQSYSNTERMVIFGLGVVCTILTGFMVKQTLNNAR